MHDFIRDITYSIGAAWILGLIAQYLRQPVLLAYLVGGFALGPMGFKLVESTENISAISELGLIFLLFMIGLEIDLKKISSAGRSITLTALVQIVGGALLGLLFFRLCGFGLGGGKWDALYLAVAGALSSTVIIVKVLYEKQALDTLAGRITLGVLVLQDLAAILFLAIQPNLENLAPQILIMSLLRVVLLVSVAMAASRYILPAIFRHVARSPELVQVGALAWCFLIGQLGESLHLSREMGALVAGVALSTFPYALDVTAKVTSLRDFFVTLFFVGLGMSIPMPTLYLFSWALVFAAFVAISRFTTTFASLYLLRQGIRISLLPAIYLSQVSEFSLVILKMGENSHHLANPGTAGLVALAFVMLAALSTFGMSRSDDFARDLVPWLRKRGLQDLEDSPVPSGLEESHGAHGPPARILFLGFFRTASSLLEDLHRHAPELIPDIAVVDYSPVARAGLLERKVRVIYGDISQRDTLMHAGIEHAEVLICTIPDYLLKGISNERLVRLLRGLNPNATIIATADVLSTASLLMEAGANYVSVPRLREAEDLLQAVRAAGGDLLVQKKKALSAALAERREVLC